MSKLAAQVYAVVSRIPRGQVLSYSQVAKLAGIKSPRFVGHVLHLNPQPQEIPCHRVIHKDGGLSRNYAFGGLGVQENKLRAEGLKVVNGRYQGNLL